MSKLRSLIRGLWRAYLQPHVALEIRPLCLSLSRPRTGLSSILVRDWKYIHNDRKDAKHKLFDLDNYPEERSNLVGQESARAGELARELSGHLAMAESQRLESSLQQVPPETVEQMRALGYVD